MFKNINGKYVIVVIVCVTLVICTLLFTNGNFYIKNLGTSLEQNGQLVNTITVTGDGKVFAKPDMVNLSVTSSEIADSSKVALDNAANKIKQVVTVAQNNGVSLDDIQTTTLNVNPEYDYNNGTPVFKGQRATVSVDIKIKGVDTNATKATTIIDQVSEITNIQIGSISFDIENKTPIFTQARKLAFDKAKQKADELSGLSGVKLLKPVSVTDSSQDVSAPSPISNVASSLDMASPSSVGSALSSGQLQVTLNVTVIWGID